MSFTALRERLTELQAATRPGTSAHEMAACVTALVEAAPIIQALWDSTGVKRVEGGRYECLFNCYIDARGIHSSGCPLVAIGTGMPERIGDALTALAVALGVEA